MPEKIKHSNNNNSMYSMDDNNIINYKKTLNTQTDRVKQTLDNFYLIHQNNSSDNDDDDYHHGTLETPFTNTKSIAHELSNIPSEQFTSAKINNKENMVNQNDTMKNPMIEKENFTINTSTNNNFNEQNKIYDTISNSNTYSYTPKLQDLELGNYKTKMPLSHELYLKNNIKQYPNATSNTYYPGTQSQFEYNKLSQDYLDASNDNNLLLKKINYLIHLYEEEKDEKTNSKNEDILLYFFLGVSVIYIVDSFTRAGKYTR